MKRFLFLVLMMASAAGSLLAQPITFENYNSNNGLYSSAVDVLQDRQGFIWFATSFGGVRQYDGYTFTAYMNDPYDPENSLQGINVRHLAEDQQGHIWMGTTQTLDRYDPSTQTFVHFQQDDSDSLSIRLSGGVSLSNGDISELYVDPEGRLWVGNQEGILHRFHPETNTFTRYPLFDKNTEAAGILVIQADPRGGLWIGTEGNGLLHFDPETTTTTAYRHDPNDPTSLSDDRVWALAPDPDGGLWVGTMRGLNFFDPQAAHATRYGHDAANPESLSHDNVRALAFDNHDRLWVGTLAGGLNRFDRDTNTFTQYRHDPYDPTSLVSDRINALLADRQGTMWAGAGAGASHFDPTGRPFILYKKDPDNPDGLDRSQVYGLHEARDGALWLGGSRSGLRRFDRTTETITQYLHDPDDPASISGNFVTRVYEDQAGRIWAGSVNPIMLNRLDPGQDTIVRYPAIAGSNDFYEDPASEETAGMLWVANNDGLVRLNLSTLAVEASYGEDKSFGMLLADGGDGFWLSGTGGLYYFNRADETIEHMLEVPGRLGMICERSREPGVLWIGSAGLGLLRYDTRTGEHTTLTAQNSDLPDNRVWGVLVDEAGHLWISMDFGGLSRFSPETGTFKHFDIEDGIQAREFNYWSWFKSPSGEMFFGGPYGINAFFPNEIANNPYPPEVVLTDLSLFDEPVKVGDESLLTRALFATEQLRLKHNQNDVSLGYVGLHFGNPEQNRYAYMLEGYDDTWRDAGSQRTATYTNLSPGRYTFRAKAANSDGVWNEEGSAVGLTILPPWWRTWWAYGLYGLLFISGVFAVDRIQRRRLLAKEREKARERELEQAREIEKAHTELQQSHEHLKATQAQLVQQEKMASLGALTAGIAHEIKNPLNFVNNFASLSRELVIELREETDPEEIREILADLELNAEKIEHHGQRADAIVRSMMQHAQGGSGQREAVDLNKFINEYVDLAYHGKRAQQPGFNAHIVRDYDEDTGRIEVVPQEMGRVLINLLGNAFDAVREQAVHVNGQYEPSVRVATCRKENAVEIRVADNGPGIPEAVRDKIFEPFFTTKPTGSGTGLGLSMSYDIVTQGHGGTLAVESEPGEGAAFVVRLPAVMHPAQLMPS